MLTFKLNNELTYIENCLLAPKISNFSFVQTLINKPLEHMKT